MGNSCICRPPTCVLINQAKASPLRTPGLKNGKRQSEKEASSTDSAMVNVKQRPQPTKMACRRADFSRPWRAEARPTQGAHVSCFGVSLLNLDVRACSQITCTFGAPASEAHCVVANRLCSSAARHALRLALHPKSDDQMLSLFMNKPLAIPWLFCHWRKAQPPHYRLKFPLPGLGECQLLPRPESRQCVQTRAQQRHRAPSQFMVLWVYPTA